MGPYGEYSGKLDGEPSLDDLKAQLRVKFAKINRTFHRRMKDEVEFGVNWIEASRASKPGVRLRSSNSFRPTET
jgi:hypothetical protein